MTRKVAISLEGSDGVHYSLKGEGPQMCLGWLCQRLTEQAEEDRERGGTTHSAI